ncbi:DNA circularization protein [Xanthomonas albilineans]|uniref:DNA circularization protein n=3 Tax=Xanthomonas albilineans TaxID=29447 RepID=UPI000A551BCB|nr:DNA circularization N-terminal domain-containing protein [Xanthomonas albilineans]
MTTYSDSLHPASFRGIAFQVNGADCGVGRRVQIHEYPQRDTPWVEDLGRATREIALDAFLIGADYIDQANALLCALETGGPGTLVHPWLGTMQVCLSAPARVRFDAGLGVATVSLSFVESGELTFPNPTRSTQAASRLAADGLATAAIQDFTDNFTVAGFQSFVAATAQGQLAAMLGFIGAGQSAQVLTNFSCDATSLANLVTQAASFLRNPAMLGHTLLNAFGMSGSAGTVAAWSNVVKLLTTTAASKPMLTRTPIMAATPSRRQIDTNAGALYNLGRQLLLAQAVGISSLVGTEQDSVQAGISQPQGSTPTTPQQVTQDRMLAARDTLLSTLDAEMHRCADAAYAALQTASAAIYADLTTRAQSAVRLTSWTPPETMPMLALAYELYADASRDAQIQLRNGIRHPGFVPPNALCVMAPLT